MAKEEDIAVTAWGLVGGGVLTGKYNDQSSEKRYEKASEEALDTADKIVEISKEIGRSPAQVAINWVRQQQAIAQIIPIIGARSAKQLEDNLGVLDFELSPSQMEQIGGITEFRIGFPWEFLHEPYVLELVHGKNYPDLEFHR
jgi:aryl-alcohol dehydrogenase-like predicted oxidoreductase